MYKQNWHATPETMANILATKEREKRETRKTRETGAKRETRETTEMSVPLGLAPWSDPDDDTEW